MVLKNNRDLLSFIKNAADVFGDRPFFVGRIKAALKYHEKRNLLPLQIDRLQCIQYNHPELQGSIVSGKPLIYLLVGGPNVKRFRELSKRNILIRGQTIAYTSVHYERVTFKVTGGRGILHKDIAGDTIFLESDFQKKERRKQLKVATTFESSLAVKEKSSKPAVRNIEIINPVHALTQGGSEGTLTELSTSPTHRENNPESLKPVCDHAMRNADHDVDTGSRVGLNESKMSDIHSSKKLGNPPINLEYLKIRELKPGYRNFYGIIVEEKMQKYLGYDRRNVRRAEIMLRVIDESSLKPFVIMVDVNYNNLQHYGLNKIIRAQNVFIKDSGAGLVGTVKENDISFKNSVSGDCSESECLGFEHLENWQNSNAVDLAIKIEDDHEMPQTSEVVEERPATSTIELMEREREDQTVKTELKSEFHASNTSIHIIDEMFDVLENSRLTLNNFMEPCHGDESLMGEQQSQVAVKIEYPEVITISDEEEDPSTMPILSDDKSALKIEDFPNFRHLLLDESQDVNNDGSGLPRERDWYSSEIYSSNEKVGFTEPRNAAERLQVQAQSFGEDNLSEQSCMFNNGNTESRRNKDGSAMRRDFAGVESNEGENDARENGGDDAGISESCTRAHGSDLLNLRETCPIIPNIENSLVSESNAGSRGEFDTPISVPCYDDVNDLPSNVSVNTSGRDDAMVFVPSNLSMRDLCMSQDVRVIIDRLDTNKLKQSTSDSTSFSSPTAVSNKRKIKKKGIKRECARARKNRL